MMQKIGLLISLFFLSLLVGSTDDDNQIIPKSLVSLAARELNIPANAMQLNSVQMRFASNYTLLPFHELLVQNPFDSADTIARTVSLLSTHAMQFENCINNASILLDERIGAIPPIQWPSTAPSLNEFRAACENLYDPRRNSTPYKWSNENTIAWNRVPPAIQTTSYLLIKQIVQSLPWMQLGHKSLVGVVEPKALKSLVDKVELTPLEISILERIADRVDRKSIFRAGAQTASALSVILANKNTLQGYSISESLQIATPLGDIVIAGSSDDIHNFHQAPLLLIDCGGDDTYNGRYAKSDYSYPYSLVLDLDGTDAYNSEPLSFGSASSFFGFTALFDLGTETDHYTGKRRCYGYSFGGVSLLYDESGDDVYRAEAFCFGASEFGIAAMLEGGGNDLYQALHGSQGYGSLGGVGLLFDRSGADRYIANATPALYPSAQLPNQNYSASQGFGSGRFGPTQDGRSISGGIGMLIDREGRDVYQASVFAQGAGIGYGIGVLSDREGDDAYQADWYAMGSSAHQSCGFLIDESGNDRYQISRYMMGGAATDFSLGAFVDSSGDDVYHALNASLGYGLTNSFALFIDRSGNDEYRIDNQLGAGFAKNDLEQTLRGMWPTFGFFFDLSGEADIYNDLPERKNNARWPADASAVLSRAYSLGIDCEWNETNR